MLTRMQRRKNWSATMKEGDDLNGDVAKSKPARKRKRSSRKYASVPGGPDSEASTFESKLAQCSPQAFYKTLMNERKSFENVMDRFGPPTFKRGDVFTSLVRSIIWQQLSSHAAQAIWPRFLKAVEYDGDTQQSAKEVHLSPHTFNKVQLADLREAGLSGRKGEYILGIAKTFASGELTESELSDLPDEEVKKSLMTIRGVGSWTADMVLMFALQRPDVLPVGDLGVRKGAMKFFGLRSLPNEDHMYKLFEDYRPYRSYASWYMWHVCNPDFALPD